MKIVMRCTMDGSPDGIRVTTYLQGHTYEVPDGLGVVFVTNQWADPVTEEAASTADKASRKMARGPRENKQYSTAIADWLT